MLLKKSSGVITVLVAFLLTGILSLGTMVLEAGRLQVARTQLTDANLSAATSMIASYDQILYDRYGLLAIDDEKFTVDRCRDYLDFNSDSAAGYAASNLGRIYDIIGTDVKSMYNLTYPSILKRQVLSRAKYHVVPLDYSLNQNNALFVFEEYRTKADAVIDYINGAATGYAGMGSTADVPAEMLSALQALSETFRPLKTYDEGYKVTLNGSSVSALPSSTGTVESNIPAGDEAEINAAVSKVTSVLGGEGNVLIPGNAQQYSETDVAYNYSLVSSLVNKGADSGILSSDPRGLVSAALEAVKAADNAIGVLSHDLDGNSLINLYAVEYFPCRNYGVDGYSGPAKDGAASGADINFSAAAVEYIFGANSSETENQTIAYNYIIATRFINNLFLTITNSPSFDASNTTNVAAHVLWAYYESFADAELLAKYNATVPFEKYALMFPIDNPSAVAGAFASKDFFMGITQLGVYNGSEFVIAGADKTNYRDALNMALWMVPNSKKLTRMADLVQLEMRYRQRYVTNESVDFLMSEMDTYCRVKTDAALNSALPVISVGGEGSTPDGTTFYSIKYVGY